MSGQASDERILYIDESGDLGFGRGSSRHFVIAVIVVEPKAVNQLKRYVRCFKAKIHVPAAVELKAFSTKTAHRNAFCRGVARVPCTLHYLVINKASVKRELRRDTNVLYNYAAGLLLAPLMSTLRGAAVHVDLRTIKVASGNSLHDYLRVKLWYEMNAAVDVRFAYVDSRDCLGIQAADMVSNAVFRHYERGDASGMTELRGIVGTCKELFFQRSTKE